MSSMLEMLEGFALSVRRAILPLLGDALSARTVGRGAGGDRTRLIDARAESAILDEIERIGLSCTIISEEAGTLRVGRNPEENYLIIDPLDGTTNALHGIPFIATSIAVATKPLLSHIKAAVVLDIIHNTLYKAEKSRGAYRDGERINPSDEEDVVESVLGVDINFFNMKDLKLHPKLGELLLINKHPRYFGANALQLCFVADGKSDAFIDVRGKLRIVDMAAAYLIVKEAGAVVTDLEGRELEAEAAPQTRIALVASGNEVLHRKILNFLKG